MYKLLIKPILFLFPPEKAHQITFSLLKFLFKIPFVKQIVSATYCTKPLTSLSRISRGNLPVPSFAGKLQTSNLKLNIAGLNFPNPVGLAAGFDKDGKLFEELAAFGFGFIEVGTVTPLPQTGNPQPRLFRLPDDNALINRMGFNNEGVDALAERLKKRKNKNIIIGGNIGKNKTTPNELAINDYVICFSTLFEWVDYFVVNVSSPNTPGLRELQEKEPLMQLLSTLQKINLSKQKAKPIFLKIAPDLTNEQLNDIVEIILATKIAGVVATNTTLSRSGLITPKSKVTAMGNGGLSGKPVSNRATEVIKYLTQKSNKQFSIIGVGGIHSKEDAMEKLNAGADLIQLYTGFIYEGPGLVKKILSE